ncbi:glutamine synthetase, partial [Streptosporangium sp. NPDC051022]
MSAESVERTVERLSEQGIDVVRVGYPDLIGTERGKDVLLEHLPEIAHGGVAFCQAVYYTSPQGDTVPVPGGL